MKVALFNTAETGGGAETVVRSLRDGLLTRGHHTKLWVGRTRRDATHTDDPHGHTQLIPSSASMDQTAQRYAKKGFYSLGLPASRAFCESSELNGIDICHMHNLHGHYFSIDDVPKLAARCPLVWTLHDHFAFTGGCAFPYECAKWLTQCGSCPELGQYPIVSEFDRTARMQSIKRNSFRNMPVTIITPSRHLGTAARQSGMFPLADFRTIPYGVDTDLFRPHRAEARRRLNIDQNAPVVFLLAQGLADPRKGIADAIAALQQLDASDPIILLAGGGEATCTGEATSTSEATLASEATPTGKAIPTGKTARIGRANPMAEALRHGKLRALGYVADREEMAACYAAANVFLFTSRAENFPCSVMEAMASGTPTVAYNIAGVDEQIKHEETGFLVQAGNRDALAQKLDGALSNPDRLAQMGEAARHHAVTHWTMAQFLDRHERLYAELLGRTAKQPAIHRTDFACTTASGDC